MSGDRVVACEAIHNLRDYGGYRSSHGGTVVTGRLFRSAQHAGATEADLARVGTIGLAAVIDLRGPKERAAAPCPRPAGFSASVILDDSPAQTDLPERDAVPTLRTEADAHASMLRGYRTMPLAAGLMRLFGRYLTTLATTEGATLIHCFAGKDRTGIAVAVAQRLLGVSADDILADYLLTNVARNPEARIIRSAAAIRARYGDEVSDAAIRTFMSCRPEYLEAAWSAMTERFGSFDAYVGALGVTKADRAGLRDRLVV